MNKRVALISANNYRIPYPVYPLGISYLYSYLISRLPDYRFSLFDFNKGSFDDFAKFLCEGEFDHVCISLRNIDDTNIFEKNCFLAHYKEVMHTARQNSKGMITLGGPGFSVFPDMIFNELLPDFAIKGEGEESLLQLITLLDKGGDVTGIEGLVYRSGDGEIQINERKHYISAPRLQMNPDWISYYFDRGGMLNIQTKRGCPFHCVYCSYPLIDGRKVRLLDARTVVANIEEMYYKQHVTYLFFTDSVFNISKEYNEELAHRLIESGMKVSWGAYFSPYRLTREELALYYKAGLTHVEFGTDSFSDTTLESYGKMFRYRDVVDRSKDCSDLGIFYAHFMILGGYGETEETLNETFEHSKEMGLTVIFPYVGMRIYPDTRLCEIALKEGLIKNRNELINPVYYVSKNIDVSTLKSRALATGQKWIFPDEENEVLMERFRAKKKRGPLWEYLRY